MTPDGDVLMTQTLKLYMRGMRREVPRRLREVFGEAWWSRGVLGVFDTERQQRLQDEVRRNPEVGPELCLDAAHFPLVIEAHLDQAFQNVFTNRFDANGRMRQIVYVRNAWAHQQDVSFSMALRGAGCMRDILLELKCPEALEIEGLIKEYAIEPMAVAEEQVMYIVESPTDADVLPNGLDTISTPVALWRELRRYLHLEVEVEAVDDWERGTATVTVRVHNTAPINRDMPEVHFREIQLTPVGGVAQRRGEARIAELGPGTVEEVQFTFPARQILGVTFDVTGEIVPEPLFRFVTDVGLPKNAVEPIQREFASWMDSLGLNQFVEEVEADVSGFHDQMPMAELRSRRSALNQRMEELQERRKELDNLYRHFRLRGGSAVADRIKELASDMDAFGKRIQELDEAMGEADMGKIELAVRSIQDVHLSLLRVEAAVRGASGA